MSQDEHIPAPLANVCRDIAARRKFCGAKFGVVLGAILVPFSRVVILSVAVGSTSRYIRPAHYRIPKPMSQTLPMHATHRVAALAASLANELPGPELLSLACVIMEHALRGAGSPLRCCA
jgi:hypothetical protein